MISEPTPGHQDVRLMVGPKPVDTECGSAPRVSAVTRTGTEPVVRHLAALHMRAGGTRRWLIHSS
jgi:hypothetical protein